MQPKDVKKVILTLAEYADRLKPHQLKEIYRVLIKLGQYPVCPACGKPIVTIEDFSWDHICPKHHNGNSELINLQPMHAKCNSDKGHEIQAQYFFDISYEMTTSINFNISVKYKKPKKCRKVKRIKPWQLHQMGLTNKKKGGR